MKDGIVEKSSNKTTKILIVVIALLLLIGVYAFVVKPAISGYTIGAQNYGANYMLGSIISELNRTGGYVQIPIGNQTLVLMTPRYCQQVMTSSVANKS
jgi:uncharacterized membrane protein